MKKIVIFLFWIVVGMVTGCVSNDKTKVVITAENYPLDTVRIVWMAGREFKGEKVPLKNGKGEVEISAPEYTLVSIINDDPAQRITYGDGIIPSPSINFFAEMGQRIRVQFDGERWPIARIDGGKVNEDYMRLWGKKGPLERKKWELMRVLYSSEDVDKEPLKQEISAIREACQQMEYEFIPLNPDSYVSLHLLPGVRTSLPFEKYEQLFLNLSERVRNTEMGKSTSEQIAMTKKSLPGQPAPDFSKVDKEGNTIRLSDLKGKYVLIDFWGTWCIPCRRSHPHLVELHEKYAPKGVYFINVAQENDMKFRDNWLKVIEEDKMTWTQILNNEGQEGCDVVRLFSVTTFPTKVLIDQEGRIVGRYLGDSRELDKELEMIFGGK